MHKNYLIILSLLFITNCSAPGSAFLGPAFTGATTKSLAQASMSFGTNQIIRQVHESTKLSKIKVTNLVKKIENFSNNSKNENFLNFMMIMYCI